MSARLALDKKHVFIDWSFTEAGYGVAWGGSPRPELMPYGVRLVTFRPTLRPEPVIVPERPWESHFINAYSTWFEDEGRVRLYYEAYSEYGKGDFSARLCYAESVDGLHWERPSLGLVEFDGSRDNNIVYAEENSGGLSPHGAHVHKDPSAPAPERYKMVFCASDREGAYVAGAVSPDGIHWTPLEQPVLRWASDTQTVVFWDEAHSHYKGYFRGWPTSSLWSGRRTVDHAVTEDFRKWPQPRICMVTDANDPPGTDIYTNSAQPWPGAENTYLAFPCFYLRTADTMETHLWLSRDGTLWNRPMRAPLLPAGPPESRHYAGLVAGQGLIQATPGEWSMLVAPRTMTHNETHYEGGWHDHGGLWRATIREDGFIAVEAEALGEFWTVPFLLEGDRLEVNAWTHFAGEVRCGVEVQDGEQPRGLGVDDCDGVTGDALWKTVTWNRQDDLSALRGRTVRLHWRLTRGRLYAFRTRLRGQK